MAIPFLELFDKLSDRFLGNEDDAVLLQPSDQRLKATLQRIVQSEPSEVPKYDIFPRVRGTC